jgi:hypothetical protein
MDGGRYGRSIGLREYVRYDTPWDGDRTGLDWRVRRPGHWGFGWLLFVFRFSLLFGIGSIPGLHMAIHLYPV